MFLVLAVYKIIHRLKEDGFKRSAKRIEELLTLDDDDFEEGEERLSLASAQDFVELMTKFRELGEPSLGLFSKGTLSATWRFAKNKQLLIELLGRNQAVFTMISPDESAVDGEFVLNGHGTWKQTIETFCGLGVGKWSS